MDSPASFYWHDYETFGTDPARDRISQFAGRRTNAELEPIGEPLVLFCQPSADVLPQPEACLITGITPQQALRDGVPEPEFIRLIHEQFMRPGTCGVGYNSIRFDDEFTRYALYRNFYDPYEREWRGGNSRWDLIDVARLCFALRPDGIVWPRHEDGSPSFRLEQLAAANGLVHARAHDALSDVDATIAFARLLKHKQPKLFAHALKLRDKHFAGTYLKPLSMQPVLHVSSKIPASRHCITVIAPLAQHPRNSNEVIAYDLASDPGDLLSLPADELRDRVFVSNADLPEGMERIPLKGVHVNKSPMLAPLEVLQPGDAERLGLNLEMAWRRQKQLLAVREELSHKVRSVFTLPTRDPGDAESALYGGFPSESDKQRFVKVRSATPEQLGNLQGSFEDARYNELLFRYRARHFPQTLQGPERAEWLEFCDRKLNFDNGLGSITLAQYQELLQLLGNREILPERRQILDDLSRWPAAAEALR